MSDARQVRLAQGATLERQGRIPEAVVLYQSVVAERPELGDVWYDLGRLLRRMRRLDDALAAYDQALAQGARDPQEIHLNRAVILAEDLNRPDAAEAELKTALELAPAYAPAWLNLGNLHEDAGRRDEARQAYESVLAIDPGHGTALARLAVLQTATTPDDPLIGRLRSALAATPEGLEQADLGFALGRILDVAGDYDAAFDAMSPPTRRARPWLGPRASSMIPPRPRPLSIV